jgi:hypothetical protein
LFVKTTTETQRHRGWTEKSDLSYKAGPSHKRLTRDSVGAMNSSASWQTRSPSASSLRCKWTTAKRRSASNVSRLNSAKIVANVLWQFAMPRHNCLAPLEPYSICAFCDRDLLRFERVSDRAFDLAAANFVGCERRLHRRFGRSASHEPIASGAARPVDLSRLIDLHVHGHAA